MASTVIASAGTLATAPGRPHQGRLQYATNDGAWWWFHLESATLGSLKTYRSTSSSLGSSSWSAKTSLTLANSADSEGQNLAVAYKNISSNDVIHFHRDDLGDTGRYHTRGAISGADISWGSETAIVTGQGAAPDCVSITITSDNFPLGIAQGDNGSTSNGQPVARKASNADAGSSWTAGFGSATTLANLAGAQFSAKIVPLASGGALAMYGDVPGGTEGATGMTDIRSAKYSSGSWAADVSITAGSGFTGQWDNDWCAVRVSDTDIHVVVRTGASSYTHRRYNGTSWSAGHSIPSQASKAKAGVFLATDGTNVWLAVIDSDAANTVRYIKWTSGGWDAAWAAAETSTKTRTYLTGCQDIPTIGGAQPLALAWAEANGGNFDIAVTSVNIAPATFEQEGYRWRDDDGSEAAASWLANQDTDISRAAGINTRLRVVVNATSDPAATQFRILYRVNSGNWRSLR